MAIALLTFRLVLAFAVLGSVPLLAGDKLVATGGSIGDEFGEDLELSGDTLLVGAKEVDTGLGKDVGAAYVFVHDGTAWVQQAQLADPSPLPAHDFGHAVALDGDTALVSEANDDYGGAVDVGSVHVFERQGGTWSWQAELLCPLPQNSAVFGDALAIQGDTAVVGSPYHDLAAGNAGAVFVFQREGSAWSHVQTLTAPDATSTDRFGWSLTLQDDWLAVGAPFAPSPLSDETGAVYLYERVAGSWVLQQRLEAHDGDYLQDFGAGLDLNGGTLLVGSPRFYTYLGESYHHGKVYVYVLSDGGWDLQAELLASDTHGATYLGDRVALDGDRALVGAFLDDVGDVDDAGSAYLFERTGTTWQQADKLVSPELADSQRFGTNVEIGGDRLIVGAPNSHSFPVDVGKVFVLDLQEETVPWANLGFALIGDDDAPWLQGTGSLAAGSPVKVGLSGMPASTVGILVASPSAAPMPFKGGTLVPGPNPIIRRFGSDAAGTSTFGLFPLLANLPSGTDWFLQAIVLDDSGPEGFTLSNALRATKP